MAKLPVKTSYFSINTYVSGSISMNIAIAIDICKTYYKQEEDKGENTRLLVVDGYGEMLTMEEVVIGSWMVFDKLFGPFPPGVDYLPHADHHYIGWNGPVNDPGVDIPMAIELFENLSSSASSYVDKQARLKTVQKWFYKFGEKLYEHEAYTDLEKMNPSFYAWLLKQLDDVKNSFDSANVTVPDIVRNYLFDSKQSANLYDSVMKLRKEDMEIYQNAMFKASMLYQKLLTSLEQCIYGFVKQIFPIKVYSILLYLFNVYLKNVVDYLKPYHAEMLKISPSMVVGGDLFESALVGDDSVITVVKQLTDSVVNRMFDDDNNSMESYDTVHHIRDYINIDHYKIHVLQFYENVLKRVFDDERNNHEEGTLDYDDRYIKDYINIDHYKIRDISFSERVLDKVFDDPNNITRYTSNDGMDENYDELFINDNDVRIEKEEIE